MMTGNDKGRVVALSGGIGGAKLALGLARVMAPEDLTIIANTGDDFEHFGLTICPDVDTLLYTLGGIANPQTGWGRANETWTFMKATRSLGQPDWFSLGDGDLALHVLRTQQLASGKSLTEITEGIALSLGITSSVLPMANEPVRTFVETDHGRLAFQDYFVRLKCAPVVKALEFEGAWAARLSPQIAEALADPALRAVVICPSNPLISIEPILTVPGMRNALANCRAPIIAVSPIIAGRAVKGPTAKMLAELGIGATAAAVAERYADLIDVFVAETEDAAGMSSHGTSFAVRAERTLMISLSDKENLARAVLKAADQMRAGGIGADSANGEEAAGT